MTKAGNKILAGLKDALDGNFSAVTIEGQRWVRSPEWQPIKTAPRDGTQVLLWAEAWEMSWGIQIGFFEREGEYWATAEGTVDDNDEDFDPNVEVFDESVIDEDTNTGPTHWMPLPAIPRSPQGRRGAP